MKSNILPKIYFTILLLSFEISSSQSWSWVKTYGTYMEDEGQSVGADQWGNVYAKVRSDYYSAGPNGGSTVIHQLFKFTSNGNLLWKKTLSIYGNLAQTDKNGNTFIVGANTITKFDSSGTIIWSKTIPSRYFENIALAPNGGIVLSGKKNPINYEDCGSEIYLLDADGTQIWNRSNDAPTCSPLICCDNTGTTYAMCRIDNNGIYTSKLLKINISGIITGTLAMPQFTFLPWGNSIAVTNDLSIYCQATLSQYGSYTTTVVKYDQQGNTLWENYFTFNGLGTNIGNMTTDAYNNIYFTGSLWSNVKYQNTVFTGTVSMLVIKLDPLGNIVWSKQTSGNNNLNANSISVSNNEIYLTGIIQGTHLFDNLSVTGAVGSPHDMYVAKLSQSTVITSLKNEKKSEGLFTLIPNPTNGLFTLKWETLNSDIKVNIINNLGQTIYVQTYPNTNNVNDKLFDLSVLPKGIYFVEVKTNDDRYVKKVVLE